MFRHPDPGPRIARGVTAGFFAAAFPLPGLQIPLSIFFAAIIRGNKVVCILPQFLANAGTMVPLVVLQIWIGRLLWPGEHPPLREGLDRFAEAIRQWSVAAPLDSTRRALAVLGDFGVEVLGPLGLGILVTGAVMAAVSYPLTLTVVWMWRSRRWRRIHEQGRLRERRAFTIDVTKFEPLDGEDIKRRYTERPESYFKAHAVDLLVDGREAYPEMIAALSHAQSTVDFETYILMADRTGRRFADALRLAALRGVKVRLLYDAVGSLGLPESFVRELREAGVDVGVYHPLLVARPLWALNRRDHRKILVVDGQLAFTGGMNISDDYADPEAGGKGWRDTHLKIADKQAAAKLTSLFEEAWGRARVYAGEAEVEPRRGRTDRIERVKAGAESSRRAETTRSAWIRVVGNAEFQQRRRIRQAYVHAIRRAQHYILLENAYFIPDRGIRRELARAVARGVKVAVAVARKSDVEIAAMAARAQFSELLALGIRIFIWPEGMLHAKTAVIDDAWSLVGSYNFNRRSLLHDLEAVVVIADKSFARHLREQTLADFARCSELFFEEHEARPFTQAFMEGLMLQFRHWL